MASIISAGTTDATSLNVSSDKTGILQLASNNAVTAVTIDALQNVGIGTASPSYKLDVSGTGRIGNGVAQGDPNSTNVLANTHTILSGTGGNYLAFGQYGSNNSYAQWIQSAYQNPSTATYNLVLNPLGGNVGIGTATPTAKIQAVVGNVSTFGQVSNAGLAITGAGATGNYAQIGLGYAGTNQPAAIGYVTTIQTGYTYGDIVFGTRSVNTDTAPTERMRIDSSGNVGIGASPSAKFDVNGQIRCSGTTAQAIYIYGAPSTAPYITINQYGVRSWDIGAGYYSSGTFSIQSGQTNGVYLGGTATSWASASDERLKDIIEPIDNALTKVNGLRSVIGKYKTDEEGVRRSFLIAQDIQTQFPEALESSDPDKLGVQYTDVIPLLVASIKELKVINDTQAETINTLTARIEALENK